MKIIRLSLFCLIFLVFQTYRSFADIPVVTAGVVNAASTLTNTPITYFSITNSFFSFGGIQVYRTNLYGGTNFIGSTRDFSNTNFNIMQPSKICFSINAKSFEVLCSGGFPLPEVYCPPDWEVFPDQFLSSSDNQGPTWVRIDFSTKAQRNIILELSGSQSSWIGGVNVQSGDTIGTNTLGPRKLLMVMGDSYTEGFSVSDNYTRWLGGFMMNMERMFTNLDVVPYGQGGTGFVNGGPNAGETNYSSRASYIITNNPAPDFILVQGSVNDPSLLGVTNGQFMSAVSNLTLNLKTNLPSTKIGFIDGFFFTGPTGGYVPATSDQTNFTYAVKSVANNNGFPDVNPIVDGWLNSNNYTNMGSDGVHPTYVLYLSYATNLYKFMTNAWGVNLLGTNSSSGATTFNVTNTPFNAIPDAIQIFGNTTTNLVTITTTNAVASSYIGDTIEVFRGGAQTSGVNFYGTNGIGNQDLIATITNIVNSTNLLINAKVQKTLTGAFLTLGHNNSPNIQAAIAAATNGSTVLIPAGNYLTIATNSGGTAYGYYSLLLTNGGYTITGQGTNTVLIGQGAWLLQSGQAVRGFLFNEHPPIINNQPFTIANLVMDGGVQVGNMPNPGIAPNPVDGLGWDISHDAFLVWSGDNSLAYNNMTWTNVTFQHWRGEMVKSIDQSTNGNLLITSCRFYDGNATAINIYPSINVTNCTFDTLFQVAEYYQAYSTNTCYFDNNICTNIIGNTFAINGGKGNNPMFIMNSNVFYISGNGNNGIETVPADNLVISSNIFWCADFANCIDIGANGYQGTFDHSNIVIKANTVNNPFLFLEIGGGTNSTDPNRVESLTASGNVLLNPNHGITLLQVYGWITNVFLYSNDCSQFINTPVTVNSGALGAAPYAFVSTNNIYYTQLTDNDTGRTNLIDYGTGSRYQVLSTYLSHTAYTLSTLDSSNFPVGAQILIFNSTDNSSNIVVYPSESVSGTPITITNGTIRTFLWTNNAWSITFSTNSPAQQFYLFYNK